MELDTSASTANTAPQELTLSQLWNAVRLPTTCQTTGGRHIEVIYRGQWSFGSGPDFRGAIISFDGGRPHRGDVEIHVRSSLWNAHSHAENPGYSNIILHVVWRDDAPLAHHAPILELSRWVELASASSLPRLGSLDESLCSVFGSPQSRDEAVRIIEAAGDKRFEGKAVMLEGELAVEGKDQVLYAGLMEAMGYSENRIPFRILAQALPVSYLVNLPERQIAEALWRASGLLPENSRHAVLYPVQWKVGRVRPANHPLRRMAGVASLLQAARHSPSLFDYLVREPLLQGLDILERLCIAPTKGPKYIGRDRAIEIASNVLLPLAVADAHQMDDEDMLARAWEAWRELPRTSGNQIERSMREHVALPRHSKALSRARHQLGLLHIYKRYCAQRLCASCPLSNLAAKDLAGAPPRRARA